MVGKEKTDPFEFCQKQMKKAMDVFEEREKEMVKRRESMIRDKMTRHRLVKDYDSHQKAWYGRFVKGGIKRGHFWIWWDNRKIRNDKNFVEVKDYVNPYGKVGFDIRSKNVELKWHWKSVRDPIKFHKETLEEWLIKKVINHGEKIMEKVS
jgi:hypothetical protein